MYPANRGPKLNPDGSKVEMYSGDMSDIAFERAGKLLFVRLKGKYILHDFLKHPRHDHVVLAINRHTYWQFLGVTVTAMVHAFLEDDIVMGSTYHTGAFVAALKCFPAEDRARIVEQLEQEKGPMHSWPLTDGQKRALMESLAGESFIASEQLIACNSDGVPFAHIASRVHPGTAKTSRKLAKHMYRRAINITDDAPLNVKHHRVRGGKIDLRTE